MLVYRSPSRAVIRHATGNEYDRWRSSGCKCRIKGNGLAVIRGTALHAGQVTDIGIEDSIASGIGIVANLRQCFLPWVATGRRR